jgi:DnaJ family protein B protein 4
MSPNHYEILGVSQDATENEIKKAYRKLSLLYHPDRNPSEEAKAKILEINNAYEVLGDPQQKEGYDAELRFGGPGFRRMDSMDEFQDINQIFNMMFGGGGAPPGFPGGFPGGFHMGGPEIRVFHSGGGGGGRAFHTHFSQSFHSPPPPIETTVEITMEESYHGVSKEITLDRWKLANNVKTVENISFHVQIPPGIEDSEMILFQKNGNEVNEQRGDIHIRVKTVNKTAFRRMGLDLHYNKKIGLKDSLCGFSFEVPHLNGKLLSINNKSNPSIISPGSKKNIPKLGMTKGDQTGNMVIVFEVEFPSSLTPEQMEALAGIL